ncbi:MAG: 30S ribosomal protein S17 [Gammaproteobacteria bacterium GWE2_42_36]|nr:MAG: 30S ribosomal protein S17 [Gammaproteobacteria bacterium GWE2_42_36]HCU05601.1 30S ribosomal protein S17 [Coxiellaceae bacterium]
MSETKNQRALVGKVISDKMDKTIVIAVESRVMHKAYGKIVKRTRKFHAHDEHNESHMGDLVKIIETKPISKTKAWTLAEVIEKAH